MQIDPEIGCCVKDLASAKLAEEVGVDLFMISIDVDGAMVHFGEENESLLGRITLDEAESHLRDGNFGVGSMLPKIEACARFIRSGGQRAIITSIGKIEKAAYRSDVGTQILFE